MPQKDDFGRYLQTVALNVSIEVTAGKLAENLKKTLSEIYAYDKRCLYIMIYLCLEPNLKHEG